MVLDLPESGYCGEAISGACTATDSSRLTLDISGLESHTFTPNRDKSVEIEGVSLHLDELTPTQENFKFVVSISFTLNETVTISCINDKVNETHRVLLKSNSIVFTHRNNLYQFIANQRAISPIYCGIIYRRRLFVTNQVHSQVCNDSVGETKLLRLGT